jgi:OOP family OmpA-OmpF porin
MRPWLGVLLLFATGNAVAGQAGIDIEQFVPQLDGRGLFSTESADAHWQWQWGVGFILHYSKNPLIVSSQREKVADLVDNRLTGDLLLSLGLLDWLEVGAALPVAFSNESNANLRGGHQVTGLGSMRLGLKFRLLTEGKHGVGLSILPALSFPTGNHNAFLGQNGTTFSPALLFERSVGPVRFLVNLGFTLRQEAQFQNLRVSDELFWRFGVGWRLQDRLELGAELFGATPTADPFGSQERRNPLEMLVGGRFFVSDRLQVIAGAGPGLSQGYGTPTFRFFAGLTFSPFERDADGDGVPDRKDRCPAAPGPKGNQGCPWPDTDGDGLTDEVDDCPTTPGPPANRGCPWPDTDGDGVPDKDDGCPTVYGPAENRGCPWPDRDKDGIADKDDRCPTVPGPAANQGCPWPDTDKDGIPDKDDRCPATPGPKENGGCPWPDTDKDGIPDRDDECPTQPGPASNKGCPLKDVVVTRSEVRIRDQIFFRTGSATILPKSYRILNTVAQTLEAFPTIRRLQIQGHTDDVGSAKYNLKLSQRRAEAVRSYLIRKGIAAERLTARGFGPLVPLRPVDKGKMSKAEIREARALNRRVQFFILEQHSPPATP